MAQNTGQSESGGDRVNDGQAVPLARQIGVQVRHTRTTQYNRHILTVRLDDIPNAVVQYFH
ncbi:MAG: hypothetical protein VW313_12950, partial [Gammaproteobacteria bacterium]